METQSERMLDNLCQAIGTAQIGLAVKVSETLSMGLETRWGLAGRKNSELEKLEALEHTR